MGTIKSFASLYLVHVEKLQAKKHSDHCDLKWFSAKVTDPICIRTTTSAWGMITMSFEMITDRTVACRHETAWTTARTLNMPSSTTLLLNDLTWQDHTLPQHVWIWIQLTCPRCEALALVFFLLHLKALRRGLFWPPWTGGSWRMQNFNSHWLFQDLEITKFHRELPSNFVTTS